MATRPGEKTFSKSRIILLIVSGILFLLVALYFAEIKKDVKLLGQINLFWLFLAFAGQFATYLLGAFVYRTLIKAVDKNIRVPVWNLVKASIITLFFNLAVPTAGISGNVYLFNFLRRKKMAVDQLVTLISTELFGFYAAMEIVILLAIFFGLIVLNIPAVDTIILVAGFLVFGVFALLIEIFARGKAMSKMFKKVDSIRIIKKMVGRFKKSLQAKISFEKIERPTRFFTEHKIPVIKATIIQVFIFLSDSFTIVALFKGLGVEINYFNIPVAFILTKIVSILPFLPGALILYEGSMAFFFKTLGMDFSTAVVATLLYRVLSFWIPIFLGYVLYAQEKKH